MITVSCLIAKNVTLKHAVPSRGIGGMITESLRGKSRGWSRPLQTRALRGISFDRHDGDQLALLGLNRADKTTILKVMASIYEPSSGALHVEVSIAAFFDVEPCRQNLIDRRFFLGLTRAEIIDSEGEIIEFTNLAVYIGSPFNTYSAGIYIRHAFPVFTNLTPEVLHVGEVHFRRKVIEGIDVPERPVDQRRGNPVGEMVI